MALTDAQLDAKVAAVADGTRKWSLAMAAPVEAIVGDAHAHALKALTDALIETPDGRQTIARARRSRSFEAAIRRLDELGDYLVYLTGECRVDVYRGSFAHFAEILPPEILREVQPEPTKAGCARVRALAWNGHTIRSWFAGPIEIAQRNLLAKLAMAARRDNPAAEAQGLLKAWATGARDTLTRAAAAAANDSAILADRCAGRDVVKPELLHPDPTLGA